MKKRIILVILALCCLLTLAGCGCEHEWIHATCTTPNTCALCGETEGAPTGHVWQAATCAAPQTCSVCGLTQGEALAHTWTEATCTEAMTCSVCGAVEGEALGHTWVDATTEAPKTCSVCGETEGEPLAATHAFLQSTSYNLVCSTIDTNMSSLNPEYSFDEESMILFIYLTAPEGTAYAIYSDPASLQESWEVLSTSLSGLSLTAYEAFCADGYSDISCCIMLLNDTNDENVLLGVLNGNTIYDVMSE